MEYCSGNEQPCPRLLELMPNHRDWCGKGVRVSRNHSSSSEEKNLELRLGPPGEEQNDGKQTPVPSAAKQIVPKNSQKRAAPAPVVGWPPVRSSRKNLSSVKPGPPHPQEAVKTEPFEEKLVKVNERGFFVKIIMEGVPIGRKVNLHLYNTYEKLGAAVDELFRALLAARKDSSGGGIMNMGHEEEKISDVLDGTGEYTLVYEDNEGDRVLVADVPWQMFSSNVKQLLVLKTANFFAPKRREDGSGVRIGSFN